MASLPEKIKNNHFNLKNPKSYNLLKLKSRLEGQKKNN